jgi:predicted protein tyrosine phosphatase
MKINIFSYKDAEDKFIDNESYRKNWISIRDIGYESLYTKMDELCKNVHILKFDDVTEYQIKNDMMHLFYKREFAKRQPVLFDNKMARDIITFTNQFDKNDMINIHCWAGKSRSQAIGYCLNQYYNLFMNNNEEDFIRNLNQSINRFNGNYDVIKVMNQELFCL